MQIPVIHQNTKQNFDTKGADAYNAVINTISFLIEDKFTLFISFLLFADFCLL